MNSLMRTVEACCIVGAVLMVDASAAVRFAVATTTAVSLALELLSVQSGTHPFRTSSSQGICVALAILPLLFASQLGLNGNESHVSFMFKSSLASAVLFLFQLQRRSVDQFVCDKASIAILVAIALLTFSYYELLKGISLGLFHFWFVQFLIFRLQYTFTFGEAYVVAFFMASVAYNGVSSVITSALFFFPSWFIPSPIISLSDPFAIISQCALLGSAIAVFSASALIPDLQSTSKNFHEKNIAEFLARFIIVGVSTDVILLFKLDSEPVTFIIKSLYHYPVRLALSLGWLASILLSVFLFKQIESWLKCRIILSRKLYHFLITLIVVPGILKDIRFLGLALVVAFTLFLVCEVIRIAQVFKISLILQQYMCTYIDGNKEPALAGRDCGPVVLAHIYLLVGCSLPVWLHLPFVKENNPLYLLPVFAGPIALGICDSAAAFVGVTFGTIRWPNSKRTVQGSVAAFLAAFLSLELLNIWVCRGIFSFRSFILPALGLSIMEGSINQVDNLFLPLFFYSSLNSISR